MHEWALAEAVLITAIKEAEKKNLKRLKIIKILIGELQQIETDIFEFALNEIIKEHSKFLKNVEFIIETEGSTLECKKCKKTWNFSDVKKRLNKDESEAIHFIPEVTLVHTRCPKCNSSNFMIKKGRGVSITQLIGEK
jgi:hydrogenase nickel incorporation protein HypA/HybF